MTGLLQISVWAKDPMIPEFWVVRVILDIAHMHLDKQMLGGNPDVALSLAGLDAT